MTTHIAVDIGSAFTDVVVHVHPSPGSAGGLAAFKARSTPDRPEAGMHAALKLAGVDWADVSLVICGSTLDDGVPAVQQAIRGFPFHGRVHFMQADASRSPSPWADARSGPAAGMLAAGALSRLIGEHTVLAVDMGAQGARGALIRDGHLPMTHQVVDMVTLDPPWVESLRRLCERHRQDPGACTLLAYGGHGAEHAGDLAASLGCVRAVVPVHAAVFSAWGMLQADVDFHHTCERQPGDDVAELMARLRSQALRDAHAQGLAEEDLRFESAAGPQRCSLTTTASTPKPKLPIQPTSGRSIAGLRLDDGSIDADALEPGMRMAGPAALRVATRMLRIPAQAVLTVDSYGNFIIEFNVQHGLTPRSPA
jgi:N-methylhydantoinase A/oxoprolinase/acetone carboxylase beta subunit